MRSQNPNRYERFHTRFSICFILFFMAWVLIHPGSKETFDTVYNDMMQYPPLFAAFGCFAYARRGKHALRNHRIGWNLIGSSCVCYLLANATWGIYSAKYGVHVPFPSWADAGWLAVFPFLIGGLYLLFARIPTATRVRLLLDSAIATSSIGALSWFFVVQKLWHRSGISSAAKLVSIAYPMLDIVAIFCALAMLNSLYADRKSQRSYFLLACGVILWSFSDIVYGYARFQTGFQPGSWTDFGWPAGALLIGFAARLRLWHPTSQEQTGENNEVEQQAAATVSSLRLMTPYVSVGASLLIVVVADHQDDHIISQGTFFLALGMLSLLLLRQVFTLWENRLLTQKVNASLSQNHQLNRQLLILNEGLEGEVEQRTRQLSSLLELTQSVNSTLQISEVVSLALKHTRTALEADAVFIRLSSCFEEADIAQESFTHCGLEEMPDALSALTSRPLLATIATFECPVGANQFDLLVGQCLTVPLLWQQKSLGMIGIVYRNRSIETTERDLMKSIGIEVGVALENAFRYTLAVEAADRDPVTGLYNHRAIHQVLDRHLEEAIAEGIPLTVCMLDLNNFKIFNDTYGHMVGDEVLRFVASTLERLCGDTCSAARYGGDEFMLVLPGAGTEVVTEFAAALQKEIAHHGFRRDGEERIVPVTLSLGMATYPDDGTTRHELLTLADTNMYEAKHSQSGIRSTSSVQRMAHELREDSSFSVLDSMVTAVDNKDSYTRQHSEDVTEYALWIAEELEMPEETLTLVRMGGLLHDLGKIGVPSEILCKPGRLTPEEYEILKRHTQLGAMIVGSIPEMACIAEAVRSHHERWDGRGYPDATSEEETPLLGRLFAIADAFSAMTTDRPYRRGTSWEKAIEEIVKCSGTQFDPTLAKAFVNVASRRLLTVPTTHEIEEETLQKAA